MTITPQPADHPLHRLLKERILILDGSMGALLFRKGLVESDYRGPHFLDHPHDLLNNPDILNLTKPEIIEAIHDAYLEAGADIIETNTFTATAVAQADYGLEAHVYEMNLAAARLAKRAAARAEERDPSRPRFVAGSMGPMNRALSIAVDVNDPGWRPVDLRHG